MSTRSRPAGPRARAQRLALTVQYGATRKGLPQRGSIEAWLRAALEGSSRASSGRSVSVTVRFVGAAEGRRLNREFRSRDYATNVLTFTYDAPASHARAAAPSHEISGDLVLCAPVVKREATEQEKPLRAHYAHLTVHGLLHLLGHDHERKAEADAMEAMETRILAGLGYPDPYAA